VEEFQKLWNACFNANANQREKIENEMKTLIKKLQKDREQIKGWLGDKAVKDKISLGDARKKIEIEMERFKEFERESKTKAFSKEGLNKQDKTDPYNEERRLHLQRFQEIIGSLQVLNDEIEADVEQIGNLSKKKKSAAELSRVDSLRNSRERNSHHIRALEILKRKVENDEVDDLEDVEEVHGLLEVYVQQPAGGDNDELTRILEEKYEYFNIEVTVEKQNSFVEDMVQVNTPSRTKEKKKKEIPIKDTLKESPILPPATKDSINPPPSVPTSQITPPPRTPVGQVQVQGVPPNSVWQNPSTERPPVLPPPAASPVSPKRDPPVNITTFPAAGPPSIPPPTGPPTNPNRGRAGYGPPPSGPPGIPQMPPTAPPTGPPTLTPAKPPTAPPSAPPNLPLPPNPPPSGPPSLPPQLPPAPPQAPPNLPPPLQPFPSIPPPTTMPPPSASGTVGQKQSGLRGTIPEMSSTAAGQKPSGLRGAMPEMPSTPPPKVPSAYLKEPAIEHDTTCPPPSNPPPPPPGIPAPHPPPPTLPPPPPSMSSRPVPIPSQESLSSNPADARTPIGTSRESDNVEPLSPDSASKENDVPRLNNLIHALNHHTDSFSKISQVPYYQMPPPIAIQNIQHPDISSVWEHEKLRYTKNPIEPSPQVLQDLDLSYETRPTLSDSVAGRRFRPRTPYLHRVKDEYPYPVDPNMGDNPKLFEKYDLDTLFFIFYYQQGTYHQHLAAKELKKLSWRYHTKYRTWFQRREDPKVTTPEFERGAYVYFDYDAGWCQRMKTDFTFEYRYLEDEL